MRNQTTCLKEQLNNNITVNSPYDDMYYNVFNSRKYLISDRPRGQGGADVYEIDLTKTAKDGMLAAYQDNIKTVEDSLLIWNALSMEEKAITEKLNNLTKNEPIGIEELIEINTVFFCFNEYTIKDQSVVELEKIKELMISHKEINMEIVVHTDCRGSSKYNKTLSEKRGKSNFVSYPFLVI